MELVLVVILLSVASCSDSLKSDIEIIKFDIETIDILRQTSDTIFSEKVKSNYATTAEYFIDLKDSVTNKIYKDSIGNVVAHTRYKNDILLYVSEYFPSGQIKGKLPERINGEYNGFARYYYENGRVKSEGEFLKGLQVKEWKNYDESGTLVSIDYYADGNINPIKTRKIK